MTDIVERIRQMVRDRLEGFHDPGICAELTSAAGEIERLRTSAQQPTRDDPNPRPCPFCKSADGPHIYTVEDFEGDRPRFERAYIECEECGGKGPDCDSYAKAVETWNGAALTEGTYEKCPTCSGHGLALNMAGEPDTCPECKGNTVVSALSEGQGGWLPIDTAPDDVPVWGWQPPQNGLHDCYGTVALLEQQNGVWFSHHDGEETFTPICWMPANKPKRPHK